MEPADDSAATVVLVGEDGTERILGRVEARRPDLALIDDLAQLQLTARRCGWSLRLRDVSAELCALVELVGLAEALAVEPPREAEVGEQLGVEEVMQPGDPLA